MHLGVYDIDHYMSWVNYIMHFGCICNSVVDYIMHLCALWICLKMYI